MNQREKELNKICFYLVYVEVVVVVDVDVNVVANY